MKTYCYKSPLGVFLIKRQSSGCWGLWFKDNLLGSYHSEMAAGDDVYTQSTGDYDWDSFQNAEIPTDIYEWEVMTE